MVRPAGLQPGREPRLPHGCPYVRTTLPDGSFVETGAGFTTAAFANSDGSTLWQSQFRPPNYTCALGPVIAVSPDGSRVFVSGNAEATPAAN